MYTIWDTPSDLDYSDQQPDPLGRDIAEQEDAALVAGMARQAIEDGQVAEMLLDSGCTAAEVLAVLEGSRCPF